MKLKRAWLAICCRCKTTTQVWVCESNITQDRAERELRKDGWSSHLGDPLCPDCTKNRPSVVEVIKILKEEGKNCATT